MGVNMRLPVVSWADLIKVLEKTSFKPVRQKGSHMMLRRADPPALLVVPKHPEIKRGTLHQILKQSGLSRDDFFDLYGRR